ncbi:porin [Curvibacter sp. HBC28]|uniref:Porin n=1 Tax=Curvibacter microcysteis TaxID=3026419 RepID=A0ABT5MK62_9BURK|nr:porin [Curvibacter sp. HBC28]MDD0816971.1 porin [Curvibacter sp. HBC28]
MKKSLMSILALAALAGGAHAQSTVQVMGLLDSYAGSIRMAGDGGRTSKVGSGGMTTSWIGFKGSEDLGGGLRANFALTSFMQVNSGVPGRFTGDTFFSRDANLGLSGDFGAVSLGRDKAPNFLPTIIFNPFGDSFTFSPLVLHANVGLFNGTGWTATTPSDTGWSNQIVYSTPKFGGLSGNVHYQFSNQDSTTGNSGKKNVGLNALYFNGPLALTAFYERDQLNNPVVTAFASNNTKKDWMLGSSYDFTVAKAFLTYGQAANNLTPKAKTTSVGLSAPVGAGKVLAAYANTSLDSGVSRKTASLGYDYFLSKRTDVYAVFMNDKITAKSTGNSFGVGIRHSF